MANSFRMQLRLQPDESGCRKINSELLYIIQGSCCIRMKGAGYDLKGTDFIYIKSETHYSFENSSSDLFVCSIIFAPDVSSRLNRVDCCSLDSNDEYPVKQVQMTVHKLLWQEQSGSANDSFARMSLYYQLLDLLESYFMNHFAEKDMAEDIRQYIFENYRDEISLDSLADTFHFSPAYLSRRFKQIFGQNFVNYLNELRLRQAAEEIRHSDSSITFIAVDNGFSSISTFYKLFKEEYGMQPLDYRKAFQEEQKKKIQAEEEQRKEQYLREYLHLDIKQEAVDLGDEIHIEADAGTTVAKRIEATNLVNVGSLRYLPENQILQSITEAKKVLGVKYLRVWNIIPDSVFHGEVKNSDFSSLDRFLFFSRQEGMIPYLSLGKPGFLEGFPSLSFTSQQIVELYKKAIDILIKRIALVYAGEQPIYFELVQFEEKEGFPTDLEFFDIYGYLEKKAKSFFQSAKVGGPGVYLLNHIKEEASIVEPWIRRGITPDFFSVKIYPYFRDQNGHMKPIADPDCIKKAIRRMKNAMTQYSFGDVPIHVNDCDSFYHTRCYLNDGLWKADFLLKLYQDCLGYVDKLNCGRLIDIDVPEELRDQTFAGINGVISSNGIEKPVYGLLRSLKVFGDRIVLSEPGCIISKVTDRRFIIIIYNYRHLNYLFYSNEKTDLPPKDVEMYLDEANNKTFHSADLRPQPK